MQTLITFNSYKAFVADVTPAELDAFMKVLSKCRPVEHQWTSGIWQSLQLIEGDKPEIQVQMSMAPILAIKPADPSSTVDLG